MRQTNAIGTQESEKRDAFTRWDYRKPAGWQQFLQSFIMAKGGVRVGDDTVLLDDRSHKSRWEQQDEELWSEHDVRQEGMTTSQ
jgi:hypothetical protein